MKRCIDCGIEVSKFSLRCPDCAKIKNKKRSNERKERERLVREELKHNPSKPSDGIPWPATPNKRFEPCQI